MLAFGEYRPPKVPPTESRIEDLRGEYLSIGVIDNNPFLDLKGSDGKARMNLSVDMFNKPIVWMGDENGPRLHLGIMMSDTPGYDDNDWGLSFEPERAFIGTLTRQTGQRRFVRGLLTVDKNEREILYKPVK